MNTVPYKNNLVHEIFVRTADENYITARWCAINQLNTDFLWLAVHALEKYLKAVLLINGEATKGYSHNIVKLYEKVAVIAGSLLPDKIEKPSDLEIRYWPNRSAKDFIANLLHNGNADNRYLIYGYVTRSEDLHMLDAMVFAIRRLICLLDDCWIKSKKPDAPTFTNRELLTRQPEYYGGLGMPLDDIIRAKGESERRYAALNLNMAFAPDDFEHLPIRGTASARNSVIIRRILKPLQSDDAKSATEGIEIAKWFLANVQVPNEVSNLIKEAIESAKNKRDPS